MSRQVFTGNVYMVDLGKQQGSVQCGYRPAVVISGCVNNFCSNIVNIVPLTTSKKASLPTHYLMTKSNHPYLTEDSWVLTEQVTTVDKSQIRQFLGGVDKKDLDSIYHCLDVQLGRTNT